jgi:hypothetical protein
MGGGRRTIGLIAGLAGAALTGYGLFSVLASASCVGALSKACPGPGLSGLWMIPVGTVLAMAGMLTGGGFLVFSALFLAIGGGALAVGALGLMPDMPVFPWLFGGFFFLGGLVPFFLGLALRRAGAAKQVMAGELMRGGVKGIGTITGVSDTGITINNNPRITIRMRIQPDDGSAPVERSKTVTVSRVAIPQAGARYPAWFDRNDPDKWMYATDMDATAPAEVKEMFARAAAGAAAAQGEDSPVEELARLSALWRDGALTDAEFADAKARLLPQIGR